MFITVNTLPLVLEIGGIDKVGTFTGYYYTATFSAQIASPIIYGFIRIPTTQDTVRNFICFTVDDIEENRFNEVMKTQYIQFNCICHLDDMTTEYGIDRHDLLGYLVRDTFNWTNIFGLQFKLIHNKESTIDSDYYCRTLKFEVTKPNSLNKARMDNPYDKLRR